MAGSGTRVKGRTDVRKASIAVAAGAVLAVTFAIPATAQDSELSGELHWRTLAGAGSYTDVGPQVAARFMELHPGVTITHEETPGDAYTEAMYASAATGRTPDIFFSHSGWTQTFADRGVSLNLSPLFDGEEDFTLDDWNQALLLAGTTVDMGAGAAGGEAHVLGMSSDVWSVICNLDMLAEAGYDEIPAPGWTYEELHELARATTVRDDSGNTTRWGFGANQSVADVIQPSILAAGGAWLDEETQTVPVTPEFTQGIRNVWDPIKEGTFMSVEDIEVLGSRMEPIFASEQVACIQGAIWSTPSLVDVTFPWDVTTMPAGPGGRFSGGGTAGWSIAADSDHPDVAWELLKFIFAPEQYELWTSAKSVVPPLKSLADTDWAPDVPNADRFLTAAADLTLLPRGPVFDSDELVTALPDAYNKYVVQDQPLDRVLEEFKAVIDAALAEKPAVIVKIPEGATSTDS